MKKITALVLVAISVLLSLGCSSPAENKTFGSKQLSSINDVESYIASDTSDSTTPSETKSETEETQKSKETEPETDEAVETVADTETSEETAYDFIYYIKTCSVVTADQMVFTGVVPTIDDIFNRYIESCKWEEMPELNNIILITVTGKLDIGNGPVDITATFSITDIDSTYPTVNIVSFISPACTLVSDSALMVLVDLSYAFDGNYDSLGTYYSYLYAASALETVNEAPAQVPSAKTYNIYDTMPKESSVGNVYQASSNLISVAGTSYVNIINPQNVYYGCEIEIASDKNMFGQYQTYTIDEDGQPGGYTYTVVDAKVVG